MQLNTIEEIVEDIRQGKMVILMDDEDRENEGDLVMAASLVRAEDINFMVTHARGLVCLPMSKERCQQLNLPLMVRDNTAAHSTAFTVSIEAARGVTTGISARDRAVTIQAAVAPDAKPGDIVQPGHIFPLMAQPGGVLTRAGHTEASCDLAVLAGLDSAAVIVEILNEDGSMARRPDLEKFAQKHGLKIGTVADLIHYRLANEKTVSREVTTSLETAHGTFQVHAYRHTINNSVHLALVKGDVDPHKPTLVRVHMEEFLCDALNAGRGDCHWPLQSAMQRLAEEGNGVIVVLKQDDNFAVTLSRLSKYQLLDEGVELPPQKPVTDLRTFGVGAQILADLGVHQMRVLSAPKRMHGLSGFGLEVVEYVPCE